jgi:large subunit ribosomal protein L13
MIFMIYIDAADLVLGRLASTVAKELLNGESVYVVNAEKAVIIGRPESTLKEYKEKRARGDPYHGPFFPRTPERIIKRTVRGMLPYKTARGSEALKRLRVFISIPSELQGKDFTAIKGAENKGEQKFTTVGKLSGGI